MIGLFNVTKIKIGKTPSTGITECLMPLYRCILIYISRFICKFLSLTFFPISMVIFLFLNIFIPLKFLYPTLEDFSTFNTAIQNYIGLTFKFAYIILTRKRTYSLNLKHCATDWTFSTLLRLATILVFLILLGGNVHRNPGPLSFCHWNLGGLPTDNFSKKFLLEAFLCVNGFDIVILGETHLTSKVTDDELNIEGYSFKRCDHPNDNPRGGIGIYYKSSLPLIFKPELTNLVKH